MSGIRETAWQPIDTADRYQGAILGYQGTPGDNEWQMGVCHAFGPEGGEPVWIGPNGLMPTHWMPLPQPPYESREDTRGCELKGPHNVKA